MSHRSIAPYQPTHQAHETSAETTTPTHNMRRPRTWQRTTPEVERHEHDSCACGHHPHVSLPHVIQPTCQPPARHTTIPRPVRARVIIRHEARPRRKRKRRAYGKGKHQKGIRKRAPTRKKAKHTYAHAHVRTHTHSLTHTHTC